MGVAPVLAKARLLDALLRGSHQLDDVTDRFVHPRRRWRWSAKFFDRTPLDELLFGRPPQRSLQGPN
jgi:hypothetical protein